MKAIPLSRLPYLSWFVWETPGSADGIPSSNPPKINLGNAEGSTIRGLYRVVDGRDRNPMNVFGDPMVVPIELVFGPKLAALRESAGLSLADLGDAAGLSRQRVHQLEAGTHRPSWAEVQALAAALDVSTEVFRDPDPA